MTNKRIVCTAIVCVYMSVCIRNLHERCGSLSPLFHALRQPVCVIVCRRAFFYLLKGVKKYEFEIYLPKLWNSLGYEGLCWKCKCEQERKSTLAWTPEQIQRKAKNLIQNIQRLDDMEDPELTDFWQLLGYRDAITPEIQRAALAAEVFWPCEIYYHAPADVRDGLILLLYCPQRIPEKRAT